MTSTNCLVSRCNLRCKLRGSGSSSGVALSLLLPDSKVSLNHLGVRLLQIPLLRRRSDEQCNERLSHGALALLRVGEDVHRERPAESCDWKGVAPVLEVRKD